MSSIIIKYEEKKCTVFDVAPTVTGNSNVNEKFTTVSHVAPTDGEQSPGSGQLVGTLFLAACLEK